VIEIGKGPGGAKVGFDLDILLRSHLLVTCNSGGGKSRTLRRIAERLSGTVQTFIIDPEGEFASLREHFPFVLVGKGGDVPADVTTAGLLAHKLLELGTSAVCDLYELRPESRIAWLAAFFDAMIDAPKELWKDAAFLLDEAQTFAPEGKEGAASSSVAAMATRGRKRGYFLGCFTQRLSDFKKTVAAQLQNVMVGPTFMDLDLERSADALSIARKDRPAWFTHAKTIDPGNFWALGRAISKSRILLKVGPCVSSHPEPGDRNRGAAPPPPPEELRRVLAQLGELPHEAERKATSEAELRAEIARLRAGDGELAAVVRAKVTEAERLRDRALARAEESEAKLRGLFEAIEALRGGAAPPRPSSAGAPVARSSSAPEAGTTTTAGRTPDTADQTPPKESTRAASPSPKGWTQMEEELYQKFKARLLAELRTEAPALLKVAATAPELAVAVTREVIEIDGKSLRGRVARLIADGYLDAGKTNGEVTREISRTGPEAHPSNVLKEIKGLIEKGLVHKTDGGRFILAPGAKVNIRQAS